MITGIIFTVLLLVFAVIDIRSRTIPNKLLLISLVITLPSVILLGSFLSGLEGMLIGLVLFGILHLTVPDKVGAGDVKLAGLIGLMVGFPLILLALPLAVIMGGLASFILVALRGGKTGSLPFAPFLCGGAIASLWFGDWIISWYLGLF